VIGDGVYAVYSTDSGATWDEDLISADENTEAGGIAPGVFVDPNTDGKAYISVWTTAGTNSTAEASVYRTTNYGTSWSLLASPAIDSGVDISSFLAVPFNNTAATRIVHRQKNALGLRLMKNFSGVETDITPEFGGLEYVPIGEFLHEMAIPFDASNTLVGVVATGLFPRQCWDGWEVYTPIGETPPWGVIVGKDGIDMEVLTSLIIPGQYRGIFYDASGVNPHTFTWTVTTGGVYGCPVGTDLEAWLADLGGLSVSSSTTPVRAVLFADNGVGNPTLTSTDCEVDEPGDIIYALVISKNLQATAPTWATIATGDDVTLPYREVYPVGAGRYIVTGVDGAIGMADDTSVDSRKGNISTTGRICGTAAK